MESTPAYLLSEGNDPHRVGGRCPLTSSSDKTSCNRQQIQEMAFSIVYWLLLHHAFSNLHPLDWCLERSPTQWNGGLRRQLS